MAASQKLSHLLQLADQGPALRAALAEEVAELLSAWPADYPESMREACEALLAKAAQDMNASTRAWLGMQLYSEAAAGPRESAAQALIEAARKGQDLAPALAQSLGLEGRLAAEILDDETGGALAIACKGAHIERAVFSALVLLTRPGRDRMHAFAVLDAFDTVPMTEAAQTLRNWRESRAA